MDATKVEQLNSMIADDMPADGRKQKFAIIEDENDRTSFVYDNVINNNNNNLDR